MNEKEKNRIMANAQENLYKPEPRLSVCTELIGF